jgi:hypothetical protein
MLLPSQVLVYEIRRLVLIAICAAMQYLYASHS